MPKEVCDLKTTIYSAQNILEFSVILFYTILFCEKYIIEEMIVINYKMISSVTSLNKRKIINTIIGKK